MADQSSQLLMFSIDIGDGKVDELLMRPTDDIKSMAQCFCLKNDLTAKAQFALERYLKTQLRDLPRVESAKREPSYPGRVHLISPVKNTLPAYSNFQVIKRKTKPQVCSKTPSSEHSKTRPEESLIKRGIQKERNMQEKRLQSQKDELASCTFTPNISHKSREIIKRKKRNSKSIDPSYSFENHSAQKKEAFQRVYHLLPSIISEQSDISRLLRPILQDLDPDFTYEQFYSALKYYFEFLNPVEQETILNL